jgi:transmembrane sensor
VKEPIHNESQPLEGAYRVAQLISGYIQGRLNPKEHDELDEWVGASDENMKLFEELTDEKNIESTLQWYRKIDTEAALKKAKERIGFQRKNHFSAGKILLYAAMVVLIAGTIFFVYDQRKDGTASAVVKNDVAPGSNKAVLTLSDGRKIILDSTGVGVLVADGAMKVTQQGGVVKYDSGALAADSQALSFNTINVPRGGQFKIILSDGTGVWLNSESELRYPVQFAHDKREVALKGEGYFEVQPLTSPLTPLLKERGEAAKKVSFSVNINGARVEVLGTHFNVHAYDNEEGRIVTLVEGKVRVKPEAGSRKPEELKPGEKAVITGDGKITVNKVDTEEATAWKGGKFYFKDATIKTIMQQLQRWYDVDVAFQDPIDHHFNAPDIPRGLPLSKVLKVLEMTKRVRFEVEGRKVRVRNYE